MQSRTLSSTLQALILAATAVVAVHAQTASARTINEPRSVYSDGARTVQEKRNVYTDGARSVLDRRSVYSDGARGVLERRDVFTDGATSSNPSLTTAGMDRTGVSAPPGGAA